MELADFGAGDDAALKRLILDRIAAAGSLSFADFMRLALYHPQHGYYVARDPSLDYQSSPNVHPVFGAAIGRQLVDLWRLLDRPARFDVFEAGAGASALALAIRASLAKAEPAFNDALRYVVQDVRPSDAAAAERLARAGVAVAAELPAAAEVEGCILSNELLDALPFHRVRVRDGRLLELRVGGDGDQLIDVEAAAPAALVGRFEALGLLPGEGCDAEVGLEAQAWIERAARSLRHGYLMTLDYGYDAAALYAPWRRRGTLLTFYRHTSGEDAFSRVGRQDVTASVDLTSLRRAGEAAGLRTLGLATQRDFLAALDVGEALARRPEPARLEAFYALRRAVVELTDPAGLGRVSVLIQGRDVPPTLPRGLCGPD